jgi:ParB-like chromosome segregation protein Spo0J
VNDKTSEAPPAEAPKKAAAPKSRTTTAKIAVSEIAVVPINTLVPYRKNPRKGNVDAVAESLKVNGQYRPLVVNKGDKASVRDEVLAGNHTLMAAKKLKWARIAITYVDVTDDEAKKIVLADNRTNDLSGYDATALADLLKTVPNPVGTGYTPVDVQGILAGIEEHNSELISEVVRPVTVDFEGKLSSGDDDEDHLGEMQRRYDEQLGEQLRNSRVIGTGDDDEENPELERNQRLANIQRELDGAKDIVFKSENYWGIPMLDPAMLMDSIPDPITTWGGPDASTDDGKSHYVWNFGLAATKGMPWDRAILAGFTYDTNFESLYHNPEWEFARLILNGLNKAIVPDFSLWAEEPRFFHLQSLYRAQWCGAFMQALGWKVMPRLIWCDPESQKYALEVVPKNAPALAFCQQTTTKAERSKLLLAEGLRNAIREVKPQSLLVYGGNPVKELVAEARLPKQLHVVFVDNYAAVRRGVVFDKKEGKANTAVKATAKTAKAGNPDANEEIVEQQAEIPAE